jgi:hypothetical protein
MASLTGSSIASSYTSLLKLNGNTDNIVAGNGSNAIQVVDGDGTGSPLYLNTDRLGIGGQPSYPLDVFGTGDQIVRVRSTANSSGDDAILAVEVAGTSAGDPFIRFNIDNIGAWSLGADNSDSDKFKISGLSSVLGTNDRFVIDTSGNIGVGHDLSSHTQKLVVKNNASATTLTAGAMLNLVNEQGAGNTASIRFSGSQQNAFLGFFDGSTTATQRIAIGVGSGGTGDGHLNVTADGNVGIGTASPFSVRPDGSTNPVVGLQITNSTSGNDAVLSLRNDNNTQGLDIWSDTNAGTAYIDNIFDGAGADINFRVRTLGTTIHAMTIDGAGKVAIGSTDPTAGTLVVSHATDSSIVIQSAVDSGSDASLFFKVASGTADTNKKAGIVFRDIGTNGVGDLYFLNDGATDGNNATVADNTAMIIKSDSTMEHISALTQRLYVKYMHSDGTTRSGWVGTGSALGSALNTDLMVRASNDFYLATGDSGTSGIAMVVNVARNILPGADDAQDLGSSSKRFDDIFSVNAVTTGSDERLKDNIADSSLGLDFVNALRPVKYQWKDYTYDVEKEEAVEAKEAVYETVVIQKAVDAKEAVMSTRQKTVSKEVEKTTTEIVEKDGKYVQKETSYTETIEEPQYEEVNLYDEDGEVIGSHTIPIMEEYEVEPAIEAVKEITEERLVSEAIEAKDVVMETKEKTFTRTHFGLIAQEVEQVLKDSSLSNNDFAGLIYDEDADRYGMRYNELIAPLIKAVQELSKKVTDLENK